MYASVCVFECVCVCVCATRTQRYTMIEEVTSLYVHFYQPLWWAVLRPTMMKRHYAADAVDSSRLVGLHITASSWPIGDWYSVIIRGQSEDK